MKVDGVDYRTIWAAEPEGAVAIIDQTRLPHEFQIRRLESLEDAAEAIETMRVRGAPLIGAAAAYGLCLAMRADASDAALGHAGETLLATRPSAVNLRWALDEMGGLLANTPEARRRATAYRRAAEICDQDVARNRAIGAHGLSLIEAARRARGEAGAVEILTHCNAGWLATVDGGTALAPVYAAQDSGLAVHVWVAETRPRNQGARLTAWELARHGVPHTLIVDNAGGHLMRRGRVDLCLVGADRVSAQGHVCNKIGTYLKALAAADTGVPFYVAVPGSTIDWSLGANEMPIEEREPGEVLEVEGRTPDGGFARIAIAPPETRALNCAFDVTPARLVTGLVTERGVAAASAEGLAALYPEKAGG